MEDSQGVEGGREGIWFGELGVVEGILYGENGEDFVGEAYDGG